MRELGRAGAEIHILSGSPEQLRSRLEQKLRLDGARWASLTLKPNLENILRLRFRALRGQLGYKLPALLAPPLRARRCSGVPLPAQLPAARSSSATTPRPTPSSTRSTPTSAPAWCHRETLAEVMRQGGCYEDTIADAARFAGYVDKGPVVRAHPHPPGSPVVARRTSACSARAWCPSTTTSRPRSSSRRTASSRAKSVLRVAQDLAFVHNFDGGALARSYLDLSRRGHVTGKGVPELAATYAEIAQGRSAGVSEIGELTRELTRMLPDLAPPPHREEVPIDYVQMAAGHNRRHKR